MTDTVHVLRAVTDVPTADGESVLSQKTGDRGGLVHTVQGP